MKATFNLILGITEQLIDKGNGPKTRVGYRYVDTFSMLFFIAGVKSRV